MTWGDGPELDQDKRWRADPAIAVGNHQAAGEELQPSLSVYDVASRKDDSPIPQCAHLATPSECGDLPPLSARCFPRCSASAASVRGSPLEAMLN